MARRQGPRRGDHIFCYRSQAGYIYTHHGIYVGQNQVIHFSGENDFFTTCIAILTNGFNDPIDQRMRDERARYYEQIPTVPYQDEYHNREMIRLARERPICIRRTTLEEFLGNDTLHIAQYNEENARYGVENPRYRDVIPIDLEKTALSAECFYKNPHHWGKYHLYSNNCETFACYCKTKLRIGVQLQLHPENFFWQENWPCVIS